MWEVLGRCTCADAMAGYFVERNIPYIIVHKKGPVIQAFNSNNNVNSNDINITIAIAIAISLNYIVIVLRYFLLLVLNSNNNDILEMHVRLV